MKTVTANYYECSVRYDKIDENGASKSTTEKYVVEALSFTEAEARFIEEMTPYISGEFKITNINPAPYSEIGFMESDNGNAQFYKVKVAYITINEKTGKEKRQNVAMLVEANSLKNAIDNVDSIMQSSMIDYVSVDASETKIVDVFMYAPDKADKE